MPVIFPYIDTSTGFVIKLQTGTYQDAKNVYVYLQDDEGYVGIYVLPVKHEPSDLSLESIQSYNSWAQIQHIQLSILRDALIQAKRVELIHWAPFIPMIIDVAILA